MDREEEISQTNTSPGLVNPPLEALSVGVGRTRVKLELQFQGRDFLLLVTGGRAHVGAVAVWDGRNADDQAVVIELTGHREGPLAGECVEILGRASGRTVTAVVGIHQDNATREEIAAIVANVRDGAAALAKKLTPEQRTADE